MIKSWYKQMVCLSIITLSMITTIYPMAREEGLLKAAEQGDLAGVQRALEKADITIRDERGNTPLHNAAYEGHKEIVELLLKHNADVDAQNKLGGTPLSRAVCANHKKIVELLLEHGADVNAQDEYGNKLLPEAARGSVEILELLLKHKADANMHNAYTRVAPLLHYVFGGSKAKIELLLKYGADIDSRDQFGRTLLHRAVNEGDKEIVKLLLEHKADVNARDMHGQTPLYHAVYILSKANYNWGMELLLNYGADINAKKTDYKTPLWVAVEEPLCSWGVVMLLSYGADINTKNNYGETLLDYASRKSNVGVAALLQRAKFNDIENRKRELLDESKKHSLEEIKEELFLAIGQGCEQMVMALLDYLVSKQGAVTQEFLKKMLRRPDYILKYVNLMPEQRKRYENIRSRIECMLTPVQIVQALQVPTMQPPQTILSRIAGLFTGGSR